MDNYNANLWVYLDDKIFMEIKKLLKFGQFKIIS